MFERFAHNQRPHLLCRCLKKQPKQMTAFASLNRNGFCEGYLHVLEDVAHMVAVMLAELEELASTPIPANPWESRWSE